MASESEAKGSANGSTSVLYRLLLVAWEYRYRCALVLGCQAALLGLKVLGLRVRRGGSEPDFLNCGLAVVTVRLKPLLDKRVEIETWGGESPRASQPAT